MPRKPLPKVIVHCLNCGKEIVTNQNRLNDGRGRFCSRECSTHFHHIGRPKPKTPEHRAKLATYRLGKTPWNKGVLIKVVCEICGKTFEVIPSRIKEGVKYCSRICSHEAKRRVHGKTHPLDRKIEMKCEWCGKIVRVKRALIARFRFCSRHCTGAFVSHKLALENGPTSIENALMDELDKRGIVYTVQHRIANWFVDIAIQQCRVAIEADGDYWHRSEKQKKKDANKDRWLISHKWRVFRFTETEIRVSAAKCVDQIIPFL